MLQSQVCASKMAQSRVEEIIACLNGINPTTEFNDELFSGLVDYIVVRSTFKVEFHFKVGITETAIIKRK